MGSRTRRCESTAQFSTLHRPQSRAQLTTHHEAYHSRAASVTPDIQLHGSQASAAMGSERQMPTPQRMLMRSFSVDDSNSPCHASNHFHGGVGKQCSDYDNVSKYLMNPNSAENIDKSRLPSNSSDMIKDHFKDTTTPLNLMPETPCQPFPTHPNIHLSKPSEPRVTFNEPIAETKTFHDPRLDDDDDYDEDSNVSSVGNHSSESNSIIYANNIIQNNLSSFQRQSDVIQIDKKDSSPSPKKITSSHLHSPPPPAFRSSSSTSSNASSSSSSHVVGSRFKITGGHNSSDTSSNSSCSSAATISLSRHRTSSDPNSVEKRVNNTLQNVVVNNNNNSENH